MGHNTPPLVPVRRPTMWAAKTINPGLAVYYPIEPINRPDGEHTMRNGPPPPAAKPRTAGVYDPSPDLPPYHAYTPPNRMEDKPPPPTLTWIGVFSFVAVLVLLSIRCYLLERRVDALESRLVSPPKNTAEAEP